MLREKNLHVLTHTQKWVCEVKDILLTLVGIFHIYFIKPLLHTLTILQFFFVNSTPVTLGKTSYPSSSTVWMTRVANVSWVRACVSLHRVGGSVPIVWLIWVGSSLSTGKSTSSGNQQVKSSLPFIYEAKWGRGLGLNPHKAWFPQFWKSACCSHEIHWVLKLMYQLSRNKFW